MIAKVTIYPMLQKYLMRPFTVAIDVIEPVRISGDAEEHIGRGSAARHDEYIDKIKRGVSRFLKWHGIRDNRKK